MEFHLEEGYQPDHELTGWRNPGCAKRARGEAEPEPPLPPLPWFTFTRRKWGCEVGIVAASGAWSSLNRELDFPPNVAVARKQAKAWARRNRIAFVEKGKGWD